MHLDVEHTGILTYGSVELCLYSLYPPGEVIAVDGKLRLEMVDRVEKADGIIILGLIPKPYATRPTCLCALFTHYIHFPYADRVDHRATIALCRPNEHLRQRTEQAVRSDLHHRSLTASLAYTPRVSYL